MARGSHLDRMTTSVSFQSDYGVLFEFVLKNIFACLKAFIVSFIPAASRLCQSIYSSPQVSNSRQGWRPANEDKYPYSSS